MSILDNNDDRMKKYCTKLGVAEMYGLLVCMVAGRTWDSVQDGIVTKKLTDAEVIKNYKSVKKNNNNGLFYFAERKISKWNSISVDRNSVYSGNCKSSNFVIT